MLIQAAEGRVEMEKYRAEGKDIINDDLEPQYKTVSSLTEEIQTTADVQCARVHAANIT